MLAASGEFPEACDARTPPLTYRAASSINPASAATHAPSWASSPIAVSTRRSCSSVSVPSCSKLIFAESSVRTRSLLASPVMKSSARRNCMTRCSIPPTSALLIRRPAFNSINCGGSEIIHICDRRSISSITDRSSAESKLSESCRASSRVHSLLVMASGRVEKQLLASESSKELRASLTSSAKFAFTRSGA